VGGNCKASGYRCSWRNRRLHGEKSPGMAAKLIAENLHQGWEVMHTPSDQLHHTWLSDGFDHTAAQGDLVKCSLTELSDP
jgi:hypothetical protein